MLAAKINRGIKKIKKNAYKEGLLKGKLEGKLEERVFLAKSLYENKFTLGQIAQFMKITIEEVRKLLTSQKNRTEGIKN